MLACSDNYFLLPWSSGLSEASTFPGRKRAIWMPHVGHTAVLPRSGLGCWQQGCLPLSLSSMGYGAQGQALRGWGCGVPARVRFGGGSIWLETGGGTIYHASVS